MLMFYNNQLSPSISLHFFCLDAPRPELFESRCEEHGRARGTLKSLAVGKACIALKKIRGPLP